MSGISLRELSKTFPTADGAELLVLDRLSFEVADQEFVCLLGPSGSGKTVSLNIIAGLLQASSGSVVVDGTPVSARTPTYGYVFQQPRLLPWMTVEDNLRFALRAKSGLKLPNEANRIAAAIELVGLVGYERFFPHQISGGQQQRVGIARAFCREPQLLLMDEPFSSLDELTARRLRRELIDLWIGHRKTVLFVTHDISEASYLADTIVIYTPKPTRVAQVLRIDAPRPRHYGSEALHEVEKQVLDVFQRSLAEFESLSSEH